MTQRPIPVRWNSILQHLYNRGWVDIFDICPAFIKNVKYGRDVMLKLQKRGLITRITVPLFPNSRGSGTAFYTISRLGFKALTGSARGFRQISIPTSTHLMHYYIKNSICTGLHLFHEAKTFSDNEIKRLQYRGILSETPIVPDFIAVVNCTLLIGEVDCATETLTSKSSILKTIRGKFESLKFFITPSTISEWEELSSSKIKFCCYLHITTGSKKRVTRIVEIASETGPVIPTLVTTSEKIMPEITYDVNRFPHISYDKLFQGVWFRLPSQSTTALINELYDDK